MRHGAGTAPAISPLASNTIPDCTSPMPAGPDQGSLGTMVSGDGWKGPESEQERRISIGERLFSKPKPTPETILMMTMNGTQRGNTSGPPVIYGDSLQPGDEMAGDFGLYDLSDQVAGKGKGSSDSTDLHLQPGGTVGTAELPEDYYGTADDFRGNITTLDNLVPGLTRTASQGSSTLTTCSNISTKQLAFIPASPAMSPGLNPLGHEQRSGSFCGRLDSGSGALTSYQNMKHKEQVRAPVADDTYGEIGELAKQPEAMTYVNKNISSAQDGKQTLGSPDLGVGGFGKSSEIKKRGIWVTTRSNASQVTTTTMDSGDIYGNDEDDGVVIYGCDAVTNGIAHGNEEPGTGETGRKSDDDVGDMYGNEDDCRSVQQFTQIPMSVAAAANDENECSNSEYDSFSSSSPRQSIVPDDFPRDIAAPSSVGKKW